MLRETRAVWIATNFRLDWPPPTYNQNEQKESLISILDNIENKNLNTVYFQVRFNSTVLFKSSYEPFSYYLTGEVNGIPGYDPLAFVIDEAHKRGLEIHAVLNMIKCFSGTEENVLEYESHLINIHPNWYYTSNIEGEPVYWLDAGLPEVRNYLTNLVSELVENYKVDGIQLDYIRYPNSEIKDDFSYSIFGNDIDVSKWRRDNITNLVESISKEIKNIKPLIKFGVTPIGIYKNLKGASGLQGYTDVYQDSRLWLQEGLIDYAVPQIYWDIESEPRFDILVQDWESNSFGKNLVIGIGSFKEEVKDDTEKMIELARVIGVEGIAFFRYSFIRDGSFIAFLHKSLPSAMTWIDKFPPPNPMDLRYTIEDNRINKISLYWVLPELVPGVDEVEYFSIYNLENKLEPPNSENLLKIIPANHSIINLAILNPSKIHYYYSVKSLDKSWNESENHSNIIDVTIPELKYLSDNMEYYNQPIIVMKDGETNELFVFSNELQKLHLIASKNMIEEIKIDLNLSTGLNIIPIKFDIPEYEEVKLQFESGRVLYLKKKK
ncbi:family 10 glycosylhydrolase [Bacteroidota bacterium]